MPLNSGRPVFTIITAHWLSMVGACLVTTAAISWLLAAPSQLRGHVANPYIGILLFIILPIVFIAGLALMPIGWYLSRRRVRMGVAVLPDRRTTMRRLALFFGITTFLNVVIGSQLTYRAVEHMETVQFCGQSCHVMKPEFAAYQNSMHSRVLCVDCHVGPGASGWFASKMAGTRQLMAVTLDNYPRPIRSAMESNRLVPAAETCERCHWPQVGGVARLRVFPSFKDDEANTATQTVLMMKTVGGPSGAGIHGAHFGGGARIRYAASDSKRQAIPWVEYRNDQSKTLRTYAATESKADDIAKLPIYEMQCVDCHNRPAHSFEMPEVAINRAMAAGDISPTLPFVKKTALELIKTDYASQQEGAAKIAEGVRAYYRTSHPNLNAQRSNDIERAATTAATIYTRNVFPELKVTWGTYPNNLGHSDFPGCFRCHDEAHATSDGKTITQDCATCHNMIAVDEAAPEILRTLDLSGNVGQLQRR